MARGPDGQIEQFAGELERALGDNLRSLVLFGSVARGHYVAGRSDINLLVIVRDARSAALRPAAETLARWTRAGETAPLIFSEDEWRSSADVYPLEIEDMRDGHRVVRGADPLPLVTTSRDDLRRQVEREVRGKLLRLRTQYAAAAPDGKSLTRLLETSFGTFLVLLRATVRLSGEPVPADPAEAARTAARHAGLDPSAFDWPLGRRAGRDVAALGPYDPVAVKYLDELEKLAGYVNRL